MTELYDGRIAVVASLPLIIANQREIPFFGLVLTNPNALIAFQELFVPTQNSFHNDLQIKFYAFLFAFAFLFIFINVR